MRMMAAMVRITTMTAETTPAVAAVFLLAAAMVM
jgi:hypothetical protein